MPCFSQPPSVVLHLILRNIIDPDNFDIDAWAATLPLLGVCRKWRKAAAPLVYRNAILDGANEHGTGFTNLVQSIADTENTKPKLIFTNIDLIKATGNTHMVKTLHITLDYPQYCQSLVTKSPSIFSFDNCSWRNVQSIAIMGTIEVDSNEEEEEEEEEEEVQSDYYHEARALAEQFAKHMPNVSKLHLPINDETNGIQPITQMLPRLYASSLKYLECCKPLVLMESTAFAQIIDLEVDLSSTEFVPRVYVDMLEHLVLKNINESFAWKKLIIGEQSSNIVFPNLLNFTLSIDESADIKLKAMNSQDKVHFPAAIQLDITAPTFAHLEHILSFKQCHWPNVTKLDINVEELNFNNSDDSFNVTEKRIKSLASNIKRNMPKVTQLTLNECAADKTAFYNMLFNMYVDQLDYVDLAYPVTFTAAQFAPQLTHLILHHSRSYTLRSLPGLFAKTLEKFQLVDADACFSWDLFGDSSTPLEVLNFEQLREIDVNFGWLEYDEIADYQMCMESIQGQGRTPVLAINCPKLYTVKVTNATINRLQRLMPYGCCQWTTVKNLHITTRNCDFYYAETYSSDENYLKATKLYAEYFVSGMPSISNLVACVESNCDIYAEYFCKYIANAYAHQVEPYECNILPNVMLDADIFLSNINV